MPAPESSTLAAVPFHFWSFTFFVFGCIVGSFLNVCIHRMPLGESVVSPPSHCPHCQYQIPSYLNIPLVTWLWLRGKCANCAAPISPRYFAVELLTGLTFLVTWLHFGGKGFPSPIIYCVLLAGFIVATFIDLEHFIIPDEITIGGIVVGLLLSAAAPALQGNLRCATQSKYSPSTLACVPPRIHFQEPPPPPRRTRALSAKSLVVLSTRLPPPLRAPSTATTACWRMAPILKAAAASS